MEPLDFYLFSHLRLHLDGTIFNTNEVDLFSCVFIILQLKRILVELFTKHNIYIYIFICHNKLTSCSLILCLIFSWSVGMVAMVASFFSVSSNHSSRGTMRSWKSFATGIVLSRASVLSWAELESSSNLCMRSLSCNSICLLSKGSAFFMISVPMCIREDMLFWRSNSSLFKNWKRKKKFQQSLVAFCNSCAYIIIQVP